MDAASRRSSKAKTAAGKEESSFESTTLESSTLDSGNHRLQNVKSPALIEVTSATADIAVNFAAD